MTARPKAHPRSERRSRETNPDVLRQALHRMVPYRTSGAGRIAFPSVPSLLEHYVKTCQLRWFVFRKT